VIASSHKVSNFFQFPGYHPSAKTLHTEENLSGLCNNKKIFQPSKFFFTHPFRTEIPRKWYFLDLNQLIYSFLQKKNWLRRRKSVYCYSHLPESVDDHWYKKSSVYSFLIESLTGRSPVRKRGLRPKFKSHGKNLKPYKKPF